MWGLLNNMPFTQAQAEEWNIINSVVWFLNRNVKTIYDTRAAATASSSGDVYTSPLRVAIGKPDDPNIEMNPPVVAIDWVESTDRQREYEIGTNNLWRHLNLALCCYPSLNSKGEPSLEAMLLLRSLMRNAMSTEYMKIVDYANQSNSVNTPMYCYDVATVCNLSGPQPRGGNSLLAQQKHRFDMHFQLKYVVQESALS